MSGRQSLGLAIAMSALAVGIGLLFGAHGLATHWQEIGPNVWGGETDPTVETGYRTCGTAILVFSLAALGAVFWRWLDRPDPS